ncbi:MAG: hypothetical protein RLY20_2920 [Verrucomicrobiota bacterium]|jgi:hypothetical protein
MEFVKKNWEKILLGVVLVGLAVAVAFLPIKINSEKQTLAEKRQILEPKVKLLEPVNLTVADSDLKRTATPVALDFSTGHRLFNPVLWQKTPDGSRIIKVTTGKEVGPDAVVILKTSPLYTTYALDSVMTNADGSFRYVIGVERQAADKPTDRGKRSMAVAKDTKAPLFSLDKVIEGQAGPELTLELADPAGEKVTLSKLTPYRRVDGYLAELKYPPENRTWPPRRKGDKLTFAGDTYNIVAITETEVVLSAPNGKMTTVRAAEPNR